jgi:hypothetical protein
VHVSEAEKADVRAYFAGLCAPPAVLAGSLTARVCSACLDPKRPQDCEAMCDKKGMSHFACKGCLALSTPTALPQPGEEVSLQPYRCYVCRDLRPHLPAHIQALVAVSGGGGTERFRVCVYAGCGRIFNAGRGACGGGGGDEATECGNHAAVASLSFECPACHIKLEHAGGCGLIRCCPKGYHGCDVDKGLPCDHRTEHATGCGHVFEM